ncbi:MAG: dephospho-CoA kinase [Betaproteobacteria bacterium]|jgi:dephospho-CoA kinase|uniref:Dephospho-CoA kinase n=1 Tax=Thiomonas delicata TaxID=364030 RepID=A0A238D3A8_THIDL|nr:MULTISPECIES: dephospho-CoA kinase [Thiomonas]MDE2130013.1 dephospho-CoA kinase [Betaproteobacteria bacterium]OZB44965.1 MAG: dephospho-CoA kinase [Thiomonas sp. 15-66-11]OZB51764.1 MAG: dephospho-CoA kinase [Thiomonas sp. 14-66-4]SBP87756.1 dephospho-CoA kinase [Thiomonas delicata]
MTTPASSAEHRLTIGLTGGIGSGKSAVAALLAALGAGVLDADAIAHELTAPGGAAIAAIQQAFGAEMITPAGALDRDRMRAAVFADPAKRCALESILHPRIGQAMRERAARTAGPYLVLVIPLLVENLPRWRSAVDRIAVVDCPESQQIARVMRRSGLDAAQVRAIMATQATREARRRAADDLIDNSADLAALQKRTRDLHAGYLRMAG